MGTKRPAPDASFASNKKRKPHHGGGEYPGSKPKVKGRHNPAPAPNPLNPLKTRIRSIKRQLAHDDAVDSRAVADEKAIHPDRQILHAAEELEIADKHQRRGEKKVRRLAAGTRVVLERELKGLEEKVREIAAKKSRADIIGRWHKVRFFERRKAERRLKKVRKEGGEGKDEEVDLNYALYWPLERDYVPLWPKKRGETEGSDGEGERKGDMEMWRLVERCMAEGTLEDLREGRVEGCGVEKAVPEKVERKDNKEKQQKRVVQRKDEDESDDGGFFEE
ncbi:hypothetical protein K461DRAFT_279520 [Myriangium duriaei CBS 260.36]|uniref:rRNA-processing protein EFG1 n=1 Tax=Myriangium duriaei CBS 260.36 TaxID=1168546 RepID=A0A9P4J411_9PEZI|nr:hypothetical protein K461DRAFT_279520 [Myriangium duriaei CBS 260.36]